MLAEKGKVVINGENFGLMEKVTLGGHFAGTSTDSKAFILENLEFITVGRFNIREPCRTGICDDGFNKGIVGKEKVFLLVTPGGTSKAFQDAKARGNFGGDILNMGSKGEVCIKGDAKDGGGFVKGEEGVINGNLRMESGLVIIRGEKCD